MAATIASSSSAAFGANDPIIITKPSGLAVGDLLLGYCMYNTNGGTNQDLTLPAGWTLIDQINQTAAAPYVKCKFFYIVATSTEVAASDFSFDIITQPVVLSGGGLLRITGQKATGFIGTYSKDANDTTTTTSWSLAGITPAEDNILIMFIGTARLGGTQSASAYAIATDNPATWTERFDITDGATVGLACATASRPQTTATGNATATLAQGGAVISTMISVYSLTTHVSMPATTAAYIYTGIATGLAYGKILIAAAASYVLTGIAAGLTFFPRWLKADKSTSTFSESSKSSTTWGNSSKSSGSWTESNKS